ncbi:hypothetical protein B0H16DRAFT_868490 [Mycena metata]|uniref:Uncharacterized protein n=1 Tax=Mycena metata TaxID=1033252 RepID=A0AAD7N8E4_9AGAR|nr:hypothetical protein B0H16DRAFT_1888402 [Mycena metata]KAJ7749640.1 hypothetical protein B0H16DRAFT_868490 [Mycena metata]
MSAAGDVIKAANAVAGAFPPLQAALSLVGYVDDSIALYKSNRNEIKAIAVYSLRLSELLERHNSVHPTNTEKFLSVILDIRAYCEKVAKRNKVVQYLKRTPTAGKLHGYRDQLWEEFAVFSIESDVDVQQFQKDAEEARKADEAITQAAVEELAKEIKSTAAGITRLADDLKVKSAGNEVVNELEAIRTDSLEANMSPDEKVVLEESIRLSKVLFPERYKWFPDTFKISRSDARTLLIPGLRSLVGDLTDNHLISRSTQASIIYAPNPADGVDNLLAIVDGRGRDVKLIRTIQRWLLRDDGMSINLRDGLE